MPGVSTGIGLGSQAFSATATGPVLLPRTVTLAPGATQQFTSGRGPVRKLMPKTVTLAPGATQQFVSGR